MTRTVRDNVAVLQVLYAFAPSCHPNHAIKVACFLGAHCQVGVVRDPYLGGLAPEMLLQFNGVVSRIERIFPVVDGLSMPVDGVDYSASKGC